MGDSRIACSIILLLWAGDAPAQNQAPNVQQIADTMVRLCIAGGSTQAITGAATGGADISLRSFDVRGNLAGQFNVSKSSAEGLVSGIDNALTQVAADQADKVRDCLAPVRQRILDVMLPGPQVPPPLSPTFLSGWNVTFSVREAGGGSFRNFGSRSVTLPTAAAIDIRPYLPSDLSPRNAQVEMTAVTDHEVSSRGQWVYFIKVEGAPQSYTQCVTFEVLSDGIRIANGPVPILTGQTLTFDRSAQVDQPVGKHAFAVKLDCFFQGRQFPLVSFQLKPPNGDWRRPTAGDFQVTKIVNPLRPPQ